MAVTIAVKIAKYYGSPPLDNVLPLRENGTQTERVEMRTTETQVRRHCTSTGSNTELHLLSAAELENAVTNVVVQHLSIKEDKETKETRVEKTPTAIVQPIPATRKQDDLRLGKNLVPRLQKLRVLDKMIDERAALVDQFDTSLFRMELALKREFIKKSRVELTKTPKADAAKEIKPEKLPKLKTSEKEEVESVMSSKKPSSAEKHEQSPSTQSSPESNSTTSVSETEEEEESTTGSSSTASSSSTSSSRETVLRRNSASSPSTLKVADQTR
ncbi:hypothetical protein ANCDUO_06021 [Ancylostoma duodenale]|uniref:Uncharacterized protein n=1 Tax=Ancylostoma duodenale TaxID=51022 RepID=A0A0C2H2K8_9BILA|nr:hypothetical protein ANCDUO_06021 [Ancylostoma duodenale]